VGVEDDSRTLVVPRAIRGAEDAGPTPAGSCAAGEIGRDDLRDLQAWRVGGCIESAG
jgi:hypothetical protein